MGAVVEHQPLVVEPAAEVAAQQGQHPVFRGDLPHENAAKVGEPGEALEQVGLPLQVAHRLEQGKYRVVADAAEQGGTLVVQGRNEAEEHQLPVRRTGEEPLLHQLTGVGGPAADAGMDALGVGAVGLHPPHREQCGLQLLRALEAHGGLFVDIALEHAAEKSLQRSVVAVDDVQSAPPPFATMTALYAGCVHGQSADSPQHR